MVDPAVAWSLRVSVPTGAPPPSVARYSGTVSRSSASNPRRTAGSLSVSCSKPWMSVFVSSSASAPAPSAPAGGSGRNEGMKCRAYASSPRSARNFVSGTTRPSTASAICASPGGGGASGMVLAWFLAPDSASSGHRAALDTVAACTTDMRCDSSPCAAILPQISVPPSSSRRVGMLGHTCELCSANTSGAFRRSSSRRASSARSSLLGLTGESRHSTRPSNTCGLSLARNVILHTTVSPRSSRPEAGSTTSSPSTPSEANGPRSHTKS